MRRPSPTALKSRARTLVERMTERARWIYALPLDAGTKELSPALMAYGFARSESDEPSGVTKWTNATTTAAFVVLARTDLEVLLIEAEGGEAAEPLGALLQKAGFFAQSALLESALDVATEDARKALLTLSHMVVAWDEEWAELFLLHLASPDPTVRHDAVTALTVAAMVARDKGPALELLGEAARRETFPKLQETIDQARALIDAIAPA